MLISKMLSATMVAGAADPRAPGHADVAPPQRAPRPMTLGRRGRGSRAGAQSDAVGHRSPERARLFPAHRRA